MLAVDFRYPPGVLSVEAHPFDFIFETRGHVVSLRQDRGGRDEFKKEKGEENGKEPQSQLGERGALLEKPDEHRRCVHAAKLAGG